MIFECRVEFCVESCVESRIECRVECRFCYVLIVLSSFALIIMSLLVFYQIVGKPYNSCL